MEAFKTRLYHCRYGWQPSGCWFCTRGHAFVCAHCRPYLPFIAHPCLKCGRGRSFPSSLCCHLHEKMGRWDRCHVVFDYTWPIATWVQLLKFGNGRAVGHFFGLELLTGLQSQPSQQHDWDAIVPVPLHPSRIKTRGFNQAMLIAEPIAAALNIPIIAPAVRKHHTLAQAQLHGAHARAQNMKQAFKITRPLLHKRLLVIDDVLTTGATLTSFVDTLRTMRVTSIDVAVVARA